jgi:hypothetical protein
MLRQNASRVGHRRAAAQTLNEASLNVGPVKPVGP